MDEVIKEIQRTRDELAQQFQNDVGRLYEYLKTLEQQSGRQHVRNPPKPVRVDGALHPDEVMRPETAAKA